MSCSKAVARERWPDLNKFSCLICAAATGDGLETQVVRPDGYARLGSASLARANRRNARARHHHRRTGRRSGGVGSSCARQRNPSRQAGHGGRRPLRLVMFQAALVAAHHNPNLKPFADRIYRPDRRPHSITYPRGQRPLHIGRQPQKLPGTMAPRGSAQGVPLHTRVSSGWKSTHCAKTAKMGAFGALTGTVSKPHGAGCHANSAAPRTRS